MALPITDNQELFATGFGSEIAPMGISVKGYLWSISQSFGKLLIKEFYSSFVAHIPLSLFSFYVTPALQNNGSFFTDRFWVWCTGVDHVLRIFEMEPNLTTDPIIHFSKVLLSDVSRVCVYVQEHDDIRLLVLSDSLPKSLSIKMYHDVKVSSPISTSVNWNSSRLDNFSNFVSSDSTQFSISYSYAASPYSAYTEDYSIPIPSIISLTQILSSADIQAVWSVSVGSDGYVLERSSEPLFLSPIEIYSGPLTTFTESSVPVGTFYYRVRAANTLVSLISLWSVVESIVVISPIVADFISNPLAGYAPLTVNFTDTSTGTPTSWNWDFGDGSTHATTQNPTHIYTVAGTYTVTLIASNIGGSDTEIKTNYITVSMVADFTGTPTLGPANLSVAFTDTSTGTPTSWDWDFGDGSTHATTQNPVHTYTVTGAYTVTLTATNAGGSDTEIKTDYITVTESVTADFTGTPTSGPANLSVAFTDTSTGTPTSWDWDFGDGSTHATTQYPTHIYTVAGTYTVTLIATAGSGSDTEIKTDYIVVGLLVDFSATPVTGRSPLFVRFSDLTIGNPTTWAWNFGDGETSSLKNPVHLYNSAGVYTVSLTASNLSASGTRTRVNYITATFYRVSTEDIAPPADRVDLRTMYGEGAGTYRYPKKGVQISTVQGTATESGFTRPNGPTLILG